MMSSRPNRIVIHSPARFSFSFLFSFFQFFLLKYSSIFYCDLFELKSRIGEDGGPEGARVESCPHRWRCGRQIVQSCHEEILLLRDISHPPTAWNLSPGILCCQDSEERWRELERIDWLWRWRTWSHRCVCAHVDRRFIPVFVSFLFAGVEAALLSRSGDLEKEAKEDSIESGILKVLTTLHQMFLSITDGKVSLLYDVSKKAVRLIDWLIDRLIDDKYTVGVSADLFVVSNCCEESA